MKRAAKAAGLIVVALLLVAIRIVHLKSDPPTWLSWSTGIYTDEGVYAGDARSMALFHHWTGGDFHSAVIAPVHTALLTCLFHTAGVSLVSARWLSVSFSLMTLVLFYETLKRQFDQNTAVLGVLFFGLSPVVVFYNRLALLETPTVFLLVLAAYLETVRRYQICTGIALALAIIYKPLALLCVPAFFVDLRRDKWASTYRVVGLVTILVSYFVLWQLPHSAELASANRYYLYHQYLPHTALGVLRNVYRNLWTGAADGVLPYLAVHATILILLAALSLFDKPLLACKAYQQYVVWLMVPIVALCLISYTPSRYFLLFWPALAAIAAIGVARWPVKVRVTATAVFTVLAFVTIVAELSAPNYLVEKAANILAKTVSPRTVVVGQYAPELCLSNSLPDLYVQPGIANDHDKVDSGVFLITKTPYWIRYWKSRLGTQPFTQKPVILDLPKQQVVEIVSGSSEDGASLPVSGSAY